MKSTRTGDTAPTRAVIYCRISQDRTGAGLGVDRQREDCEALAQRNGWDVVETYVDNDVSAYSGKTRKDYRRMLADLDVGAATVVVAWHTDRLHRSPTELEEYIDLSERRGITTHTVQAGAIDLSTPSGRMTARILGAVARQESEHKGHRVARARMQKARAGEWAGGIRPFGWGLPTGGTRTRKDKATGEETEVPELDMTKTVPEEAEAIRTVADMVLGGGSLRACVKWLTDKGFVTPRGNPWGTIELRDLLLRPRLAGISVYRGEEIGPGNWEAILQEPQWRALVAILTDPSRRTTPGNTVKWFGSMIYRCGATEDCAHPMYVTQSGGRRHPSYRCRTGHGGGRRADKLDRFVQDVIIERLSRDDAADLLLPPADGMDVALLQAEATVLRQRLAELSALFAAGTIDAAQLAEGSKTAHGQLDGITQQLARAALRDPVAPLVGVPDVRKAWEGMELEQQREVLRALLDVTVRPQRPGRMPDGGYFDYEAIGFDWKRGRR